MHADLPRGRLTTTLLALAAALLLGSCQTFANARLLLLTAFGQAR